MIGIGLQKQTEYRAGVGELVLEDDHVRDVGLSYFVFLFYLILFYLIKGSPKKMSFLKISSEFLIALAMNNQDGT